LIFKEDLFECSLWRIVVFIYKNHICVIAMYAVRKCTRNLCCLCGITQLRLHLVGYMKDRFRSPDTMLANPSSAFPLLRSRWR